MEDLATAAKILGAAIVLAAVISQISTWGCQIEVGAFHQGCIGGR
ncbi:hypothetical protein [Epibacterium ulvae]|nr:hypothetical protein [Epibacterium ulvae]